MVKEGKIPSRAASRSPLDEEVSEPLAHEVVVFEAFFEVSLGFPSMPLLEEVFCHYYVELLQLHANAIAILATFEWAMLAEGCEGRADFFAALHFASCQPKMIKGDGTKRPIISGSVNFQIPP